MASPPLPALRRLRHLQSTLACSDPAPPLNLRQQPAAGGRYRVADVNTTDIVGAIELACSGAMSNVFNADDDDIPFFSSNVRGEGGPLLAFSSAHSESHVPGRHLNAMLNAEDAAGILLDETAVSKHATAAFFSYSLPGFPLPLNRTEVGGPLNIFTPHNVREGFHALYPLVQYRGRSPEGAKARALAEESIAFIQQHWSPGAAPTDVRVGSGGGAGSEAHGNDAGWDAEYFAAGGVSLGESTFIVGLARTIGPLVKYYRATAYAPALDLAVVLKNKCLAEFFTAEGGYDRATFGTHTHSTTCVMSGLALLAELTGDAPLMARVYAFYSNGLWEIRDALGWVIENSADDAPSDMGEVNNSGDILETALLLGRAGYVDAYQDAERIVRVRQRCFLDSARCSSR